MLDRDRLLASALGLAVLAEVVFMAGYVVRLVDLLDEPGAGTDVLRLALGAVGAGLLVAAYGIARKAFVGARRWQLLALAAMLAAAGYALHAASAWIEFADAADNLLVTTDHEVAAILQALSESLIVIVALATAAAFRRSPTVAERDGRLAGAACLAVGVEVLGAASFAFFAADYFHYEIDSVAGALVGEAAGAGLLGVAAAAAAVAFLRSRRPDSDNTGISLSGRERTLALAAAVFAVGTLCVAIGEGRAIGEGFGVGVDGAFATGLWLFAAGRLVFAAAALTAATAFALGGWGEPARVRLEELIRVVRGRPRQQ